jgi:hypothetical protein
LFPRQCTNKASKLVLSHKPLGIKNSLYGGEFELMPKLISFLRQKSLSRDSPLFCVENNHNFFIYNKDLYLKITLKRLLEPRPSLLNKIIKTLKSHDTPPLLPYKTNILKKVHPGTFAGTL